MSLTSGSTADEGGGDDELPAGLRLVGGQLPQERFTAGAAHLACRVHHGGECRCDQGGGVDVVVAGDGEFTGHAQAEVARHVQHAYGDEVVGAGDGVRPVRPVQEDLGRFPSRVPGEVAPDDEVFVDHPADLRDGTAKTRLPEIAGAGVPDAAEVRHPAAALFEQVADRLGHAALVVGADHVAKIGVEGAAPEPDQRRGPSVRQEVLSGQLERDDDHAVDGPRRHLPQESDLLIAGPIGIADEHVIPGRHHYLTQATQEHRIEGVGQIGNHQADGHRAPGAQTPGERVGLVAQLLDDLQYPAPGALRDRSASGQHVGDRGDRNTGLDGNLRHPDRCQFDLHAKRLVLLSGHCGSDFAVPSRR